MGKGKNADKQHFLLFPRCFYSCTIKLCHFSHPLFVVRKFFQFGLIARYLTQYRQYFNYIAAASAPIHAFLEFFFFFFFLISAPHDILSKPLVAFPHNHYWNNGQPWERNESCCNDYHQSPERILAWLGIEPATSFSWVLYVTDRAMELGMEERTDRQSGSSMRRYHQSIRNLYVRGPSFRLLSNLSTFI